jgi:acyl dehydratase
VHELPAEPTVKISPSIVGATAGPRVHAVDARWVMAYAAALGDTAPEYLDTTRRDGIVGHPLFPVCYEWPLALALRARTLRRAVAARGVHATHDLRLHRRPRAGDRLSTRAAIVSVESRAPGVYVVTRFETVDGEGRAVSTSDYGSIYRGVTGEGMPAAPARDTPPPSATEAPSPALRHPDPPPVAARPGPPDWSATVSIPPTLAHVYSECARIWNPIHTDAAVARAAGLPGIILHGTATLALSVSTILEQEGMGPAAPVARIACRFGAMVLLPSALQVVGWRAAGAGGERVVAFQALTQDGRAAIRDGRLTVSCSGDATERPS